MRVRMYKRSIVKWIVFMALFFSILIMMVSLSLYRWYSSDNIKSHSEMNLNILKNAARTMEMTEVTLRNLGFLTVNDNHVSTMMNSRQIQYSIHSILQTKMADLIFTNPLISSAFIVNKKADWVVGSPSTDLVKAGAFSDAVHALLQDAHNRNAIARVYTYPSTFQNSSSSDPHMISYIFFQTVQSEPDDSFLMLNVKESDMFQSLVRLNPLEVGHFYIVDAEGIIRFAENNEWIDHEMDDMGLYRRIAGSQQPSGYFVYGDNGQKRLVAYTRSDELGYVLIDETPYELVRQSAETLRNRTILLSILILLVGIAAATLLAKYFYAPMNKLVNKYIQKNLAWTKDKPGPMRNEFEMLDRFIEGKNHRVDTLDHFINENIHIIKQDFFKSILEGKIQIDRQMAQTRLMEFDVHFPFASYRVVGLYLDNQEQLKGSGNERPEPLQAICGIAEETMRPLGACECVWSDDERMLVLLVNYDEQQTAGERVKDACLSLQQKVLERLAVSLSVILSDGCTSDIGHAYRRVCELAQYKIKYGDYGFIDEERVASGISSYGVFPEEEEKELLNSMKSLSREAGELAITKIVNQFYSYSITDIQYAVDHILYNTFQVIKHSIKNGDTQFEIEFIKLYKKMMDYTSLQELEDNMISFYETIIKEIEASKQKGGHHHAIAEVVEIIEQEYDDSSLSLELVADRVRMHPVYFGRIFKENMGLSFTDYVKNLRLEKSKQLLLSTGDSVKDIAAKVGFNSTAYFVTCFKGATGMTPSLFRSQESLPQDGDGNREG